MNFFTKIAGMLFGGGKGIVEQVSDVADKWKPSPVTQHNMAVEDVKVGDDSQKSAREMQLPAHNTWFDSFVDGAARLVRPVVTYWILGGLAGFYQLHSPSTDPLMMNLVWTVMTFWFGSRLLIKDFPAIIKSLRG